MRIALLADFPVHALPGFEQAPVGHHATWLLPLSKELESASGNYDFHWITCTKAVTRPRTIRFREQTFHLLPRGRLSLEILSRFARERKAIAKTLGEIQPDLVHAWGTEQGYAFAANDFPGDSIISVQGILQTICKAAKMPVLTRIQARHEAAVLSSAKHLTVESEWGEKQLRDLAPHAEIHRLQYGIAADYFQVEREPTEKPLAIFVGTLSHLKGIDTLLDAFSDERLCHIDLAVIGGGASEFSERSLPENISFLGHLPATEVRAWMAKAWCLVHPSRADTSPNVVKEARVVGLPVVTTSNGGQTEYVTDGHSGVIHPANDPEALIQGILTVTADRETSLRMGAVGQSNCRAALSSATTAARLLEIYQHATASGA